jgi:hypothetical protein
MTPTSRELLDCHGHIPNNGLGSPACFQDHRQLPLGNRSPPKCLAKASASSGFPIEPPQFAELEERVGRRLVERHVGAYRLTELGRELRPATESVESAVAGLERRLAAYDKGLPGALEVADIFCDTGQHGVRPMPAV